MSEKYKVRDQTKLHFITFAVVRWTNVFAIKKYVNIVIESLKFCQKEKGLEIFAWCVMPDHVHFILGSKKDSINDIVRDFKKFTSVQITRAMELDVAEESRRMLDIFKREAQRSKKHVKYKFWQDQYHPIELNTNTMMDQKLDYIHENPVKAGLVEMAEKYLYSSARDYYVGEKGLIDIEFIE